MKVHGDAESKLTTSQYKNFLCNSPIVTNESYGSFRHHYRIDGRLIGLGHVDMGSAIMRNAMFLLWHDLLTATKSMFE